jgi:hypothetical protein
MLTVSAILQADYAGLPDVSERAAGLDRVLRRMLAKAPADRYPTMADCLSDLRRLEYVTGPVEAGPVSAHLDGSSSARRRWRLAAIGTLGALAVLALLYVLAPGGSAPPTSQAVSVASPAPAPPVSARVTRVSYWLEVEPPAALKAETPGFPSLGDQVYGTGWRFRVHVQPPGPGHVYLIADEPPQAAGQTGLALLYTSTQAEPETTGAGTGVGTRVTTDWFVFTGAPAREHLWLVWSAAPVEELTGLATLMNARDRGVVRDEASAQRVRALLTGETARATTLSLDRGAVRATLASPETMVVHRLELQHD